MSVRAIVRIAGLLLLSAPRALSAQTVQVAPFIGYDFRGDLYEASAGRRLDVDGARSFGVTVDVLLFDGTSLTFVYSRQQARVEGFNGSASLSRYAAFSVDRWHVGGTQDFESGRLRPFLAGSLGLTRFGSPYESEVRFSLAGGGGVKLLPSEHFGVRLEGRLYAVIMGGSLDMLVCGGGGCLIGVDVGLTWQAEFTAGLVFAF